MPNQTPSNVMNTAFDYGLSQAMDGKPKNHAHNPYRSELPENEWWSLAYSAGWDVGRTAATSIETAKVQMIRLLGGA